MLQTDSTPFVKDIPAVLPLQESYSAPPECSILCVLLPAPRLNYDPCGRHVLA